MQREFYIVALTQKHALENFVQKYADYHEDVDSAKEQRAEDYLSANKIYRILVTAECVEENGTPVVKADLAQGGV